MDKWFNIVAILHNCFLARALDHALLRGVLSVRYTCEPHLKSTIYRNTFYTIR